MRAAPGSRLGGAPGAAAFANDEAGGAVRSISAAQDLDQLLLQQQQYYAKHRARS